jgi:hypothetical protein
VLIKGPMRAYCLISLAGMDRFARPQPGKGHWAGLGFLRQDLNHDLDP